MTPRKQDRGYGAKWNILVWKMLVFRARGVTQMLESLPSRHKALGCIPSTTYIY